MDLIAHISFSVYGGREDASIETHDERIRCTTCDGQTMIDIKIHKSIGIASERSRTLIVEISMIRKTIYIYMERGRERQRDIDRERTQFKETRQRVDITTAYPYAYYIYIYIYIYRCVMFCSAVVDC